MKIGSLFSGYGGLDLAAETYFNASTVWQAEWENSPSKVLAHRFPGVPNLRDVTAVDWAEVEPVDIIAGGFPCQDVSMAGKRAGMVEGTRSNLWGAMRSAIEIIRPRYVVAENVMGLLSAKAHSASDVEQGTGCVGDDSAVNLRALGRVLGDLAELGYNAKWYGLRAADIGAPHNRFRVFIFATDNHGQRSFREERGLQERDAWAGHKLGGRRTQTASDATDSRQVFGAIDSIPGNDLTSGIGVSDTSTTRETGSNRSEVTWGAYEPAIRRWERILGRPAPRPTEPTGRDGRQQLSPRFTEWMMGLPEGWITEVPGIARGQQIKMCGNGVVPQQALAALRIMGRFDEP